jgi:arylsulfatase A-like enzyme
MNQSFKITLFLLTALTLKLAAAQPNILFIFSDDHAKAALSCYGDSRKLIETPSLDRIAKEGVCFDRCLVTNSICGPSRATILTGKYSHKNGFYNNINSVFNGEQTTFIKILKAAGYQTAIIGKWHLVADPVGFDHWSTLPGQGEYYNPKFKTNGTNTQKEGYVTDIITEDSVQWLEKRDPSKPFVLMCQHKSPHREWSPALRHLGHNNDRIYPEPANLYDDYQNRAKVVAEHNMGIEKSMTELDLKFKIKSKLTPEQQKIWDAYYQPRNDAFLKNPPKGKELVSWNYQRYMHDYLGCVKSVDESIAKLLKYLDDHNLAENTLVVYSSDQGFYLGEHGWFDKRWIFEESLSTPLLMRWPKHIPAGTRCSKIVSNLDFAQTFIEAAQLPNPSEMQGFSLLPLAKGNTPNDWRKAFYYHYYEYPVPHQVSPHYGIITDRYKLVHFYGHPNDEWNLFDLVKDPQESRSFYQDPDYQAAVTQLKQQLDQEKVRLQDTDPTPSSAFGGKLNSKH